MGVRSSDIMALMAIIVGAGAGYGLTSLYAHSQQEEAPAVAELTPVVESAAPRVDVEVEPIRIRVGHVPTVVVQTVPHVVTRMHMHRLDRWKMMEIRQEARARAQEARERARDVREDVLFGEAFELQEALSSLEALEGLEALESLVVLKSLEALESLDAIEGLGNLENMVDLEALEQALKELGQELDGVLTIDLEELDGADDQHKRKKRKKRRIIVKRPGDDGSGG